MKLKTQILLVLTLGLVACTQGHCRRQKKGDSELKQVWVYKSSGSKQCEKSSGKTVKVMRKELSQIQVFASESRSDGKMRAQVCGADAGSLNAYLINNIELEAAKKLGFKVWPPQ